VALILLGVLIGVRADLRRDHHGTGSSAGSHPAALTVHTVLPARADPGVTGPDAPSLAIAGAHSHANGLLLVFLAGTGGTPNCCTLFLSQAASLGYLAIGLGYANQTAVGVRCLNNLACFGEVRANVFDGSHPSTYSDLSARDGISDRLAALLRYLSGRYPDEGWSHFLHDGEPVWSSIVMSGHSQGGGEAVFIGTVRRLRGAIALSSPPDTSLAHRPATWLASVPRGPTPLRRIVAFVHDGDPFYGRILSDWNAMRLSSLGPASSVDGATSPYGGAHELLSSARLPSVVLAAHDSTAVDSATPRCDDGSPEYAPVWDYMLEVAAGLPVARGSTGCS